MAHGTEDERQLIRQAIRKGGLDNLPRILEIVERSGAIEYTMSKAREQADLAKACLQSLPDSGQKMAMELLTEVAVARVS